MFLNTSVVVCLFPSSLICYNQRVVTDYEPIDVYWLCSFKLIRNWALNEGFPFSIILNVLHAVFVTQQEIPLSNQRELNWFMSAYLNRLSSEWRMKDWNPKAMFRKSFSYCMSARHMGASSKWKAVFIPRSKGKEDH